MDDWVTVHLGHAWQAELYKGLLAEHGIDAFLPDANTKVTDPFATGAMPMETQVQVRKRDVDRAMEMIASAAGDEDNEQELTEMALSTPPDPDLGISDEEACAPDDATSIGSVRELARDAVERLAARTRWAALLWITFPWAIACGLRYLGVARRRGIRATKHRLTVAALGLALLEPLIVIVVWIIVKAGNAPDVAEPW